MKVYQPCYYNGEYYEERLEVDSRCIYRSVYDAIKEIENHKVFNMNAEKYQYNRYSEEPEMFSNIIFMIKDDKSLSKDEKPIIYIDDYELYLNNKITESREKAYAYIKVFELK